MIEVILKATAALWISIAAPELPAEKVMTYSDLIVEHSLKHEVSPEIVVAVTWHESNFRNLPNNSTNDRGLMQVHWSPSAPWLKGLRKADLMIPEQNIKAGVHELAWWRNYHEQRCRDNSHPWWSHYKWGVRVKNQRYGRAIARKKMLLLKSTEEIIYTATK